MSDELPKGHPNYWTHYELGYLRGTIKYGFGSYLRNVKLPGGYFPHEIRRGRFIEFAKFSDIMDRPRTPISSGRKHELELRVMIDYSGEGAPDSFFDSMLEWNEYDIGSGVIMNIGRNPSGVRYFSSYLVSAVVQIRDETYYFFLKTKIEAYADDFVRALTEAKAVEEVDGLIPADPTDKPRAFGATFFVSGENSRPSFERALAQLYPDIKRFLMPIHKLEPTPAPTTDISSKVGGIPYCPPGSTVPKYRNKPLDFVLQINFGELNVKEQLPKFPEKGLLQLWVTDFMDIFDKDAPVIYKGDNKRFKVCWYPDPIGGYVTEENGIQIVSEPSSMLPTELDLRCEDYAEEISKVATQLVHEYTPDFAKLIFANYSHIGGSPEFGTANRDNFEFGEELDFADDKELLLQFEFPQKKGRIILLISPEALAKEDFDGNVTFVAYEECPESVPRLQDETLYNEFLDDMKQGWAAVLAKIIGGSAEFMKAHALDEIPERDESQKKELYDKAMAQFYKMLGSDIEDFLKEVENTKNSEKPEDEYSDDELEAIKGMAEFLTNLELHGSEGIFDNMDDMDDDDIELDIDMDMGDDDEPDED